MEQCGGERTVDYIVKNVNEIHMGKAVTIYLGQVEDSSIIHKEKYAFLIPHL